MDAKDRLAGTLVMLYLFSSAVYVFSNHDYSEVISSYLAIVKPMLFYVYGMLFLAGLLGLLSSRGDSGQFRLVAKNFFLSIFLSIVLVPVVCVLFLLLGYPVIDGMNWLFSGGHDAEKFSSITAAAVVIIGWGFFQFRLRMRCFYGLTEVMAGVFFAAHRSLTNVGSKAEGVGFYFALLTAGVYLVVRGLDNIHQGLTKDPKDKIAIRLLGALKILPGDMEKQGSE